MKKYIAVRLVSTDGKECVGRMHVQPNGRIKRGNMVWVHGKPSGPLREAQLEYFEGIHRVREKSISGKEWDCLSSIKLTDDLLIAVSTGNEDKIGLLMDKVHQETRSHSPKL